MENFKVVVCSFKIKLGNGTYFNCFLTFSFVFSFKDANIQAYAIGLLF